MRFIFCMYFVRLQRVFVVIRLVAKQYVKVGLISTCFMWKIMCFFSVHFILISIIACSILH